MVAAVRVLLETPLLLEIRVLVVLHGHLGVILCRYEMFRRKGRGWMVMVVGKNRKSDLKGVVAMRTKGRDGEEIKLGLMGSLMNKDLIKSLQLDQLFRGKLAGQGTMTDPWKRGTLILC